MNLVTSILAIAIAVVLYIYTVEFFIALFRITGLTKEKARFQVISLITCAGFTTSEAEIITTNKKRRRLAIVCMITGTVYNVLIISFILNLINSAVNSEVMKDQIINIMIILSIAVGIIIFTKLPFVSKVLEKITEFLARKIMYRNKNYNTLTMLDSYNKDAIIEILVNDLPQELKNKTLEESDLKKRYNINLLMIKRGNRMIDITRNTVMQNKDEIVVFGNRQTINYLFANKKERETKVVTESKKENVVSLIDNYGSDAMAQVKIVNLPEVLVDKKLCESDLKTVYGLNILTIKRNDVSVTVTKDTIIQENDTIVVYGKYKYIKSLFIEE